MAHFTPCGFAGDVVLIDDKTNKRLAIHYKRHGLGDDTFGVFIIHNSYTRQTHVYDTLQEAKLAAKILIKC